MVKKKIKKVRVNTTINEKLIDKFKEIADEEGRRLNYYIEKGLETLLKEYGEEKQ